MSTVPTPAKPQKPNWLVIGGLLGGLIAVGYFQASGSSSNLSPTFDLPNAPAAQYGPVAPALSSDEPLRDPTDTRSSTLDRDSTWLAGIQGNRYASIDEVEKTAGTYPLGGD